MAEQGKEKSCDRGEENCRCPQKGESEKVHGVGCKPEDPLPYQGHGSEGFIEVVDPESTGEAEISHDGISSLGQAWGAFLGFGGCSRSPEVPGYRSYAFAQGNIRLVIRSADSRTISL